MFHAALLVLASSSTGIQGTPAPDVAAGPKPVIALLGAITVPSAEGRFDHLALDLERHALLALDKPIPAYEPHGALYLHDGDLLVVTNAGWETLDVFDASSLARKARVQVGPDADNVRYERNGKLVYVGVGEGDRGALAVVDTRTWELAATIPVGGHPESFQFDAKAKRAFVNVPSLHGVVVVDLEMRKVIGTWRLEPEANYPMAIQGADRRLFIACRKPPTLLVLDPADGRVFESLELGGDADDVFLDEASGRVFASCGEGTVDVFERADDGRYTPAGRVPTAPGARTCLFSPGEEKLFVAVPRRGESAAEIRVYDTRP